ncbi:multidrug efflux pump subunit AcrA (membrane-fusion protein), partial [Wenyingzhuangia heitensis]
MKNNSLNGHKMICLLLLSMFLINCSDVAEEKENLKKRTYLLRDNEVTAEVLKTRSFQKELISNGKLIAIQKNILKFEIGDELEGLYVCNGERVKKGHTLARLSQRNFLEKLEKAELNLKKSTFDLEDNLLGRGYTLSQKESIPNEVYEMLSIKSGYRSALQQVEEAKYQLSLSSLKAPFNGKVANLTAKKYDQISSGTSFLTL